MYPGRSLAQVSGAFVVALCAACRSIAPPAAGPAESSAPSPAVALTPAPSAPDADSVPPSADSPSTNLPDAAAHNGDAAHQPAPAYDASNTEASNAPPASAHEHASSEAEPAKAFVHGDLQTRLVERWSGGANDLDLYEVLSLELGDAARDRVSGHLTARAAWDVDGSSSSSVFASLADTHGDRVETSLYDAYADVQRVGPLSRVRLGRQFIYDTPLVAWFDGALAEFGEHGPWRASGGVYGGVPVHLDDPSSSGDAIGGAFVSTHPSKNTSLRADWMHVDDRRAGLGHDDDLYGLSGGATLGEHLRVNARYTRLEERDRDLTLGANWVDWKNGVVLDLSFYALLEAQADLALELDPFFEQLLTLFPYHEVRATLSKDFGATTSIAAGVDAREVSSAKNEGPFNHDYLRGWITTTLREILPGKITLALTGESWSAADSSLDTWGVDCSRKFGATLDASLGSYFSLYRFDPLLGSERNDVRTYYGALRWRRTKDSTFDMRYEIEDQTLGTFQALRVGVTWHF